MVLGINFCQVYFCEFEVMEVVGGTCLTFRSLPARGVEAELLTYGR